MKKSLILVGLLSIGYAHAQQYDGKVGINTETPTATLDVKSATGTDETTKNLELQNANGKKLVTVLDNGNVGIGTDAPVANLQIDYEGDNPIKIKHKTLPLTDGNLKSQIVFADKDDNAYGYIGDISRLQRLGVVGVNYTVGIGSNKRASFDNPSATNILAQTDILVNSEDDNNRILLSVYNQENPNVPNFGTVIDNWGRWHIGWENTEIDNRGNAKVNIRGIGNDANSKNFQLSSHNNTRLLTVLNNGNVGFGTEAPKHRLHIENDQWYPIAIQNTSYEASNGALKSSIVFKDKDGNSYGYVGDVSSHKRLSLLGQSGYQVSIASSKLTGNPNATVVLDPGNDIDRIVLQTLDEENNRVNNTYIDKQGNWRVGVSTVVPEKFAIGGNLRVEGLKGSGDRPVYVDANGVLKIGTAPAGGGAQGIAQEVDGVIGNELSGVIENGGLVTSGDGTTLSPLKVGMAPGTVVGQTLVWNGTQWEAQTPQNGASLNSITGGIRTVTHIAVAEWATPNTFALIQTGDNQIQLPSPSSYAGRIIAVNNQYNNKISYFATNQPKNAGSLESGKGHILMSDGNGWYIIGGSY